VIFLVLELCILSAKHPVESAAIRSLITRSQHGI